MHVVAPLEKQFQILYGLLNDHISENVDYKVSAKVAISSAYELKKERINNKKEVSSAHLAMP